MMIKPLYADYPRDGHLDASQWSSLVYATQNGTPSERQEALNTILAETEPLIIASIATISEFRSNEDANELANDMRLKTLMLIPNLDPEHKPYEFFKSHYNMHVLKYLRNNNTTYGIKHYGYINEIPHSFNSPKEQEEGGLDSDSVIGKQIASISAANSNDFAQEIAEHVDREDYIKRNAEFVKKFASAMTEEDAKKINSLSQIIREGLKY